MNRQREKSLLFGDRYSGPVTNEGLQTLMEVADRWGVEYDIKPGWNDVMLTALLEQDEHNDYLSRPVLVLDDIGVVKHAYYNFQSKTWHSEDNHGISVEGVVKFYVYQQPEQDV